MIANSVPEVLKSKGISAETVEALSSFKSEPGWLTEKRLHAWRVFEELPMPSLRDEAWRYTDISDVQIEDFLPYAPSPAATRASRDWMLSASWLIRGANPAATHAFTNRS